VLELVRRRIPSTRLVFVGKGEMPEDEQRLQVEASRLGLGEAISITGWLPMHKAWQFVRRADVCVSPYYPVPILNSTSPTKLIEYMAFGKPVVGNRHPEQSAILEASGAGFVCAWDEQAFADAIVRVLENAELAVTMGLAGRRYVREHRTHDVMTELVANRYREFLDGPIGYDSSRSLGTAPPEQGVGH
jgi:glycosyltransferase involved in cell wall biosynthesis